MRMTRLAVLGTLCLLMLAKDFGRILSRPIANSIREPPIQKPIRQVARAATLARAIRYISQLP
ncbi:MAG: hypothetical protein A4E30_01165 [Methanomassiliicoccales archaeon PtaB.Bin215]|nr:MAG: hypothetical protein A4E30_01165 [Methanomassiliicoccales archaeon PtaB.Bin215]